MNILHILPMNKMSGAERVALLICKEMVEVNSVVVTGGPNLAVEFQKKGIQAYDLNFSLSKFRTLQKQLNNLISEHSIDIIHAHDNIASLVTYLTKKKYKLNVKIVSHIHNCYPWLENNGLLKGIDKLIRQFYDYNIACGQVVYDYYKKNASYVNLEKMSILSNAIDLDTLGQLPQIEIATLREQFNISFDKIIIGYIGRLSYQKGLIPFIQTLSKDKESFNDCQFLIVGSGEEEEILKKLVHSLDLDELFIFVGFQSDVYPFYQLIDIFFLPSLYEGLPMVLLEAMGSGVPTISMNVGSISEVIVHEENGYLIQRDNYKQFIEHLNSLKNNVELREKFSMEGMKQIDCNFNIKQYSNSLYKIYSSIL